MRKRPSPDITRWRWPKAPPRGTSANTPYPLARTFAPPPTSLTWPFGFCAYRRVPRTRGASDARLMPLEPTRRRRGLKVAVDFFGFMGITLRGRPSPSVSTSARPSVCVRCPRHENLPTQGTKTHKNFRDASSHGSRPFARGGCFASHEKNSLLHCAAIDLPRVERSCFVCSLPLSCKTERSCDFV